MGARSFVSLAIAALAFSPASAGGSDCRVCAGGHDGVAEDWPRVRVVYAQPTYVMQPVYIQAQTYIVVPPPAYVLDPSDARPPIYIVNQGPTYTGPGITTFARPTYSEGGYAYAQPYPYVGRYHRGSYRHYSVDAPRPYVPSWRRSYLDRGPHWASRPTWGGPAYRPRDAYRYRPAPNARVIEVAPRR